MAQIDFSAAYRDLTKGATLKALALRRQQAAEEQSAAMQPRQMTSPWQGAAQMAETAVSGLREGLAASQETAGRQRLAELLAGGISPDEMGEATILDPDLAMKHQEHAWTKEATDAAREAQIKDDLLKHGWDVDAATQAAKDAMERQKQGQGAAMEQQIQAQGATAQENDLNRQADVARQKISDAAAAGRQEDQQAATEDLARINAQLDQTKAEKAQTIKEGAIGGESAAKVAEAERLGLVKGTPEYQKFVFDISPAASTNIYNQGDQPAFQKKSDELASVRLDETVRAGAEAAPFMANLRILADLGKQVGTGKGAELVQRFGPYAQMVGIDLAGLDEGQAFKAIVDKMAPQMRAAGSGPSSDYDARQFLSSLPTLGRTEKGNAIINATFEALTQHKVAAAEIAAKAQRQKISWQDAEAQIRALSNPYDDFKKNLAASGITIGGESGDGTVNPEETDEDYIKRKGLN